MPALFVTHDRAEAVELADSLVLYEPGRTVETLEAAAARRLLDDGAVDGASWRERALAAERALAEARKALEQREGPYPIERTSR